MYMCIHVYIYIYIYTRGANFRCAACKHLSPPRETCICMCIYIYIYVYMCVYIYIYIYIYISPRAAHAGIGLLSNNM